MEKIAIAIGKDHSVIRKLRDLKAEVETAFETAWKKKPCVESMTFEVLYKLAEGETPYRNSRLLERAPHTFKGQVFHI